MSDLKEMKIIVLGSSKVGKTSVLKRYFKNEFDESFLSTIGIEFTTQYFKFDDEKIRVDYVDTAGQETFRAISANYIKKADGVILIFDITERSSFDLINMWIDEINKHNNINNIGKILLGNKIDLEDQREVQIDEGENLASSIKCKYMEVSAKTGDNVTNAMEEIAKDSYKYYKSCRRDSTSFSLESSVKKVYFKKQKKKRHLVNCCQDL
jgi:Ras-related protein Rab-1A